jgi:CDGSH-type Zn-finger protein
MENQQEAIKIELMPNGPIMVYGNVEIKHSDGTITTKEGRTAMCRCGQSANKPFCDGTHKRCGWTESNASNVE